MQILKEDIIKESVLVCITWYVTYLHLFSYLTFIVEVVKIQCSGLSSKIARSCFISILALANETAANVRKVFFIPKCILSELIYNNKRNTFSNEKLYFVKSYS